MSGYRVLVVGSGGREHALAWALARSESVGQVEAAPGNPGLEETGPIHAVAADDVEGIAGLVRERGYDLVVIGPEAPLAAGLADRLRGLGTPVFGPGAKAARLEASKAFSKEFMRRHGVPTAEYRTVTDRKQAEEVLAAWGAPVVVKASGLAGGKGVVVAETEAEAAEALTVCFDRDVFGAAGRTVVLEEKLLGEEASVFAVTDGTRYHLLPGSQDHKRAYDGDRGPNTGGMGAYSPAPVLTPSRMEQVEERIVRPTLEGLGSDGMEYRGVLYFGLMMTEAGPKLLEYNVRFGDPETQAVLPRLGYDLGELFREAADGALSTAALPEPTFGAAACVVVATDEYPRRSTPGLPIDGIEKARAAGVLVFLAGAARSGGRLVTAGGRVLSVVGTGGTLAEAIDRAYAGIPRISFEGMRFRRDIGWRALSRTATP